FRSLPSSLHFPYPALVRSRHRAAIALGDAMIQVDTDAAHARGAVVADQLLALQAPLVDCYSSCGLDAGSARDSMARIIAALGLPDRKSSRLNSSLVKISYA